MRGGIVCVYWGSLASVELWFRLLATYFFINSDKEVSKKTPPQHLSPAKSAGYSQNSTLKTGAAELTN